MDHSVASREQVVCNDLPMAVRPWPFCAHQDRLPRR